MNPNFKTCSICGETKDRSLFKRKGLRCRECWKIYLRARYSACKEEHKEKVREYQAAHRDERAARNRERRRVDPLFKLADCLRAGMVGAFRRGGYSKESRARELVGIDFALLKNHLEYTWFQNYGSDYAGEAVHIDHVVPCASAETKEELERLQHWTNLQYLTPEDNLDKRDKL